MTGQEAVNVAKTFDEKLDITGVILTKLDGDTRGGAALSVRAVTGKPIKFAGTGEKLDDLEVFHPDRMASRILGMGDVLTLIEEAQSQNGPEGGREGCPAGCWKIKWTSTTCLDQFKQVKQMGPLKSVLSKMPGMEKQLKDVDIDDRDMDRMAAIILSMTQGGAREALDHQPVPQTPDCGRQRHAVSRMSIAFCGSLSRRRSSSSSSVAKGGRRRFGFLKGDLTNNFWWR